MGFWVFMHTSKAAKIPEADHFTSHSTEYTTFTDNESMVLTLVKSLLKAHPPETKFCIVFDNFFTSYMSMNKTDLGVWLCSLDNVAMLLNA
jgi:hypothetical protein